MAEAIRRVAPLAADGNTEVTVMAALLGRNGVLVGQGDIAPFFGHTFLGLPISDRWTQAISTALIGSWADPLDAPGGKAEMEAAFGLLHREVRAIHLQLVPLWRRRTYGNKRVTLLETPVNEGMTLRDLLADRQLPDDLLLDRVPGDRRLAAVLDRLAPAELAVVLARGHRGVATWAEAAELAGSTWPEKDGEKVRRKVGRAVQELRRQDGQRTHGPTGLWTPARNGGAR
ncbi:hypothetical protein AB0D08_30650 [Kitasatospora sp. NPDC048540]|uniref:hypothetical protein n=1 Tax=Kitasatospora sp. NPDC048540 TaxID=3155634 RepID=UPI0033EDBAFD